MYMNTRANLDYWSTDNCCLRWSLRTGAITIGVLCLIWQGVMVTFGVMMLATCTTTNTTTTTTTTTITTTTLPETSELLLGGDGGGEDCGVVGGGDLTAVVVMVEEDSGGGGGGGGGGGMGVVEESDNIYNSRNSSSRNNYSRSNNTNNSSSSVFGNQNRNSRNSSLEEGDSDCNNDNNSSSNGTDIIFSDSNSRFNSSEGYGNSTTTTTNFSCPWLPGPETEVLGVYSEDKLVLVAGLFIAYSGVYFVLSLCVVVGALTNSVTMLKGWVAFTGFHNIVILASLLVPLPFTTLSHLLVSIAYFILSLYTWAVVKSHMHALTVELNKPLLPEGSITDYTVDGVDVTEIPVQV